MSREVMIAVLAAGASRRLGQPKQLVSFDGEPLLHRTCRIAIAADIGHVAVVLGCESDRCAAAIQDLPVTIMHNEHWPEGMASSIRAAAHAAIKASARGLLIFHCDQHCISAGDLQKLHSAWTATGGNLAARCRHENYAGPPVILPVACLALAGQLSGEEGAKRVLAMLGPDGVVEVDIPGAEPDLDLPEQLPLE